MLKALQWRGNWLLVLLLVAVTILSLGAGERVVAQEVTAVLRKVRTFENDYLGLTNPVGLAYASNENLFFVVDAPAGRQSNIVGVAPFEERISTMKWHSSPAGAPIMAYDSGTNRLLFMDSDAQELVQVTPAVEGAALDSGEEARYPAHQFGLKNPTAMALDAESGRLFFVDGNQLVRISLTDTAVSQPDAILRINLAAQGVSSPQGLALHPVSRQLYVLSPSAEKIYALSQAGRITAVYDFAGLGLTAPQALVIAPSGDPTDDATVMNLFVIDAAPSGSQIVELSMTPANQPAAAVANDVVALVNITDMSLISPPSPDTSGLAYLSDAGTLLASDSEVNETGFFNCANLYELNLSGSLLNTYVTLPECLVPPLLNFSDEPTGVAFNSGNRHLFISDDKGSTFRGVYEWDPGPDTNYNTSDDVVTTFALTNPSTNADPEGAAFDSLNVHAYVVDGLGEEVYKIEPGPNGNFDGVGTDDVITMFDTTALGIGDPEGIEFNPDNGHLYILSSTDALIAETLTDGTLLRYLDLTPLADLTVDPLVNPSGLAYAPSSANPAENHLYIVARGIDSVNDGKMYEVSFPVNVPPYVNAGPDQQINLGNTANLDGTVYDEGLPSPPANVTITWSMERGPGAVTFGDASAVDTTAGFSAYGYYVLRLTADDGDRVTSDDVDIIVVGPNGELTREQRVDAKSDDAKEASLGEVKLNSQKLEMVELQGDLQTVGIRFNGIEVPPDATILDAYVQFKAAETDTVFTMLTVKGEAADNPGTFTATANNITGRPKTAAAVSWSPQPWETINASGPAQRTSDLAPIIQELVNRPGWTSGNSIVTIIDGGGKRVAWSFNGGEANEDEAGAPLLHIEYCTIPQPVAPVVAIAVDTVDETMARLTWDDNAANGNGYAVLHSTTPYAGFTLAASLGSGVTLYEDSGAVGTVTENHYYLVRGVNGCNAESNDSNVVGEFDFPIAAGE